MRKVLSSVAILAVLGGLLTLLPSAQGVREARFAAVGDFGARPATRGVLDAIAATGPTAALALGDLAYKDAVPETAWCSFVKQSLGEGFPFQLLSGNHDSLDVGDGAINNYSSCLPNQIPGITGTYGREYYMDFPRTDPLVRAIQVSPQLTFEGGQWNYNVGNAHYQWLSNAIDSGRAAGAKWIIVSAHLPCWSVGQYNCQGKDIYDLLLSKRVDLVLHGHEHGYMRTHQLASGVPGCTTVPTGTVDTDCVRDSDNAFVAGQGTVFATVGTGGTPLRDVNVGDSEAGYFAAVSGNNLNAAYGFLDIQAGEDALSAKFVKTTGTFSDSFVIVRGGATVNLPPQPLFTTSVTDQTLAVNGSASQDPDGSIASYSWNFGDGSPAGTTPTATHTYPSAGTYSVTLTVTDNQGLTNSLTKQVTVAGPAGKAFAKDTFTRNIATGLGSAEVGGAYTITGSASLYSVDGSSAAISLTPGTNRRALLRSTTSATADVTMSAGYSGTVTGGGLFVSLMPRAMADSAAYRAKVVMYADGTAKVSLTRVTASGAETTMATTTSKLTGVTSAKRIMIRTQVSGSSPTTLRARIWFEGTPEPTTWAVQTTDSTAGLQGPGGVGFFVYESGSSTSGLTARLDNLSAEPL